ncbi:MAG TPA: hypothetical protein PK765_05060 [bacterium]|nr:hypothetical protein [bacterium]
MSATGGLVDRAQDTIRQARDLYETTQMRVSEGRDFVDRKNAEFQALMDSMRQAKEIADKLQNDLDTLTTLSVSGSADTEASLRELEENMNEIRTLSGVVSGTASSSR